MNQDKLDGKARLALNGIFRPFDTHGLGVFIPGAIEDTMKLLRWYHEQMSGDDKPFGKVDYGWKRSNPA